MTMAASIVPCANVHVALFLHDGEDPSAAEWAAAMKLIADFKARQQDALTNLRCLAVTDGGAPNSIQRKQLLVDLFEGRIRSAAVTTVLTNRLKRGIATAISWVNPNFRAVPPEELDGALEHLGLLGEGQVLIEQLEALQAGMPRVETLWLMARALEGHGGDPRLVDEGPTIRRRTAGGS